MLNCPHEVSFSSFFYKIFLHGCRLDGIARLRDFLSNFQNCSARFGLLGNPTRILSLESSVIQEFFLKFHGGLIFFENVKKTEQLQAPLSSAIAEDKKYFFSFLAIFDKIAGHRVTKIHQVSRINTT